MGSAGAHSKKPRVVRGSERLTTQLSELAGLVLAGQEGFKISLQCSVIEVLLKMTESLALPQPATRGRGGRDRTAQSCRSFEGRLRT